MDKIIVLGILLFSSLAVADLDFSKKSSIYDDVRSNKTGAKRLLKKSQIDWSISEEQWLNLSQWKQDLKVSQYKESINYTGHFADQKEIVGKLIKCIGECLLYRGIHSVNSRYLSRVREGDEIQTKGDSIAWVYLMDGTLVRVSSHTNIAFNEINISEKKIFIFARLGDGQVFWYPRSRYPFHVQSSLDSDPAVLPLRLVEANKEYLIRKEFQRSTEEEKRDFLNYSVKSFVHQHYKELNRYIGHNNSQKTKKMESEHILALPNVTIVAQDATIDALHRLGGKSYLRARGAERDRNGPKRPGSAELHFRGYGNSKKSKLAIGHWFEVGPQGKSARQSSQRIAPMEEIDLLTEHIPTLLMAREVMFQRSSLPFYQRSHDKEYMEKKLGHRFWGDTNALEERKNFLINHIRKQETANLLVVENAIKNKRSLSRFESLDTTEYNDLAMSFYQKNKESSDREMLDFVKLSEAEFFYWVLSNANTRENFSTNTRQRKSPAQRAFLRTEYSL